MSDSTVDLMIKIAQLYYRQRLTQGEVAARVGVSRQTVSRLLQRAEDVGIVTVEIRAPRGTDADLARRFEERFPEVTITLFDSDPSSPAATLRTVARGAARACERRLAPGATLGIAWGITALEFARGLSSSPHPDLTVVQIDGSIPGGPGTGGSEYVVHEAADSLGATARPLMSPLYVDNRGIRDALMSDTRTAETLQLARAADIVVFSAGVVDDASGLRSSGFLSSAQLAELRAEGAAGEVCGQFFALDGQPRGLDLASRSISLSLDEIIAVPVRLLVAAGPEKAHAVLGAIAAGLATDVFADVALVRAVLDAAGGAEAA